MKNKIPSYLLQTDADKLIPAKVKSIKLSFLDKTILSSAGALKSIYQQAENASRENVIHRINPHIKLISLLYMAIVISIVISPFAQILIASFILLLYIIARLNIFLVYRKIFIVVFIFGFLAILPASLNVITPGEIIFKLISFDKSRVFWIYNIPQNIGFTLNGFQVVSLLFLRVLNSVSFSFLVVYTTSFPAFIKSFKIIGLPDTFLMIISLAYKYIFILSRTIEETYFALKSKLSGNIKSESIRKLVSGRIFFIFKKSVIIYENTYYAMVSRGYNGKVILHSQNHFTILDGFALFIIVNSGILILLL
jgi:cobalt/nickel transport system permease protein